jgi:hypothetical protein
VVTKNSGLKTLHLVLIIAVIAVGVGISIAQSLVQVDSVKDSVPIAIKHHDDSATAHPEIQKAIVKNTQAVQCVQKSVDSLLTQAQVKAVVDSLRHKELLREIRNMKNGDSP